MTDLFFEIRRGGSHIFLNAKDTDAVVNLKRKIEGILSVKPEAQQLFNGDNIMQDDKKLSEVGFNGDSAGALQPAVVVLSMKKSDGTFEGKSVTPLSTPPPLDELLRRNVEQSAGAGDQKSGPVPSSATTEPQTA